MGTENIKKYRPDLEFIGAPHEMFEFKKKTSWFEHDFVKRVITAIDNARVELGFSVRSLENGDGYSVNDLSGGSKYLILMYERRNEPVIIRATGGDNCSDFIEEIAAACEKDGRDLIIASNYFYWWNFKFTKNVYFYNWDMTCSSRADLQKAFDKWYEYERPVRRELTEEEQEEEDAMLEEFMQDLMQKVGK